MTTGLGLAAALGAFLAMTVSAAAAILNVDTYVVSDLPTTPAYGEYDAGVSGGPDYFGRSWTFDNSGSTDAYWVTLDGLRFFDTVATDLSLFVGTAQEDYVNPTGLTSNGTVLPAWIVFSGQNFSAGATDTPFSLTFRIGAGQTRYLNLAGASLKGGGILFDATASVAAVPLPAALPLLAAGLGGLALVSRRRRG